MTTLFIAVLHMGLFVKFVIFFLIGLGVWSWSLFGEKTAVLKIKEMLCDSFEKEYHSGEMLDKIYNRLKDKPAIHSPFARVFYVGMRELKKSNISTIKFTAPYAEEIKKNIRERVLSLTSAEKMKIIYEIKGGTNSLASIAALSPFIGLIATVWSIVDTFKEMSTAQELNIQAVLPGIAEAMFPIVFGLGVCIPAVYFYNNLTARLNKLSANIEIFTLEVANGLGRELDIIGIKQNNDEIEKQSKETLPAKK